MLGFKCSSTYVGFGVGKNLTWYQSVGLKFNSPKLHQRWGVGVLVQPPHGITTAPLGIYKTSGLTATPGDRALCWVSMFTNIYRFWCNRKPYMVLEHRSQLQFPRAMLEAGCWSISTTSTWYNHHSYMLMYM